MVRIKRLGEFRYLLGLVVPLLVFVALYARGLWAFSPPVVLFIVFPLLELFLPGTTANLSDEEERAYRRSRLHDVILYVTVPAHVALLGYFLHLVSTTRLPAWELFGVSLSMGMSCGVIGINVAHELGHRKSKAEQLTAKALLMTSLYMHFFIEHNRGHHARVATPDDPATARYGESLFRFLPRTLVGSLVSAWHLEVSRLRRRGQSVWSWRNEMLVYAAAQLGALVLIGALFGPVALAAFVLAAGVGILLLESVNYIEHYGLVRQRRASGSYERTLPVHSWNSNHSLGRLLLFELTRHSDHHANAGRRYQILRHHVESPQLPTGYPGMMVLAWLPPVWFRVMHRHIERQRALLETGGQQAAFGPMEAVPATTTT